MPCELAPYSTVGYCTTVHGPYDWGPVRNGSDASQISPYGYSYRNCTDFVAWTLASLGVPAAQYKGLGNADTWGSRAPAHGLVDNGSPAVGAVAVSTAGGFGHVALVINVSGAQITVAQYNKAGTGAYSVQTGTAAGLGFSSFVHFEKYETGNASTSTAGGSSPSTVGPGTSTPTFAETVGGVTHTWTNYSDAGGTEGPSIGNHQTVAVSCAVQGFKVADGNTWWYRIASAPWSNQYYASADAFYNNGATSGSLAGTPFVDPSVPGCGPSMAPASSSPPPPPAPTFAETVGGVTHTWTNYSNAGGTQGPSIASNQTVQISCAVQGFKVADGNTWWYRIASAPWSNQYYASADAFYNNGATSGSLAGTPFVDPAVPAC